MALIKIRYIPLDRKPNGATKAGPFNGRYFLHYLCPTADQSPSFCKVAWKMQFDRPRTTIPLETAPVF